MGKRHGRGRHRCARSCTSFGGVTLAAHSLGKFPDFKQSYLYRCALAIEPHAFSIVASPFACFPQASGVERNLRPKEVLANCDDAEDEGIDLSNIRVQTTPRQLSLTIPACPSLLPAT